MNVNLKRKTRTGMHIGNWAPGTYLDPPPRGWSEFVLDDLQHGIRLIQQRYPKPIDPHFFIDIQEQNFMVCMPLGINEQEQQKRRILLRDFMAWKGASSFVMVNQTHNPDAVLATAVSSGAIMALSLIHI